MRLLLICFCLLTASELFAQTDSSTITSQRTYTHRDSVYLAKLNNSGNLMIAAGVGLCGAGGYLIYQGVNIYNTAAPLNSTNPSAEVDRNHRQGTLYLAAAGVGIAGGIILTALGARNKVDFKRRKKAMQLQTGFLDSGAIGLSFAF